MQTKSPREPAEQPWRAALMVFRVGNHECALWRSWDASEAAAAKFMTEIPGPLQEQMPGLLCAESGLPAVCCFLSLGGIPNTCATWALIVMGRSGHPVHQY